MRYESDLGRHVGALTVSRFGQGDPVFRLERKRSQAGPVLCTRFRGIRIDRRRDALRDRWGDRVFLNVQRSGRTVCREGEREFSADAGGLVLVDPCAASSMWSSEGSSFLSVPVSRGIASVIEAAGQQPFGQVIDGGTGIGRLLLGTLNLLLATDTDDAAVVRAAQGMIGDLLVAALDARNVAVRDGDAMLLARMRRWTRERVADGGIGPGDLARMFAMSERSLYRFFTRQGTTPDKWIWQQRLEVAREQLKAAHASVTSIALQVGFKDLSHFSRAFSRAYGTSPKMFLRRSLQGECAPVVDTLAR